MKNPKLYKYRYFSENIVSRFGLPDGEQISQWEQVLYDGLIFPAHPESFNDPYDCDFLVDSDFLESHLMRELLIRQLSSRCTLTQYEKESIMINDDVDKVLREVFFHHFKVRNKHFLQSMKEDINKAIKSAKSVLQVTCFSEVNDSILMWSHYAQNHSGFCIEYDFNNWESKKHLKPVKYIKDRHTIRGNDLGDKTRNIGTIIIDETLYKADVWSYEREWRIIFTNPSLSHPEYNGKTLVFYFKDFITGVYLGAQAQKKYIQKICEHFSKTSIPVYQMQMRQDKYELVATRLQ